METFIKSLKNAGLDDHDRIKTNLAALKQDVAAVKQEINISKDAALSQFNDQYTAIANLKKASQTDFDALKKTLNINTYKTGNLSDTLFQSRCNFF